VIPCPLRSPLETVRLNARMAGGIGMLAVLIAVGILWYSQVEGWSVLDAAYMTVITFTTVGFSEVRPLDTGGRLFTMISPVFGVGLMLYILTSSVQMVVEGEFIRGFVRRRRMTTRLAELRDHYILCGYGRMGTEVARSFQAGDVPFVVIERLPDTVAEMTEAGILAVLGDATSDDVLRTAGVQRAKGLVASTGNDSDNVFIALSARGPNPDLVIVSRADAAETESKLLRAGATRVVSPYTIGGRRLALSVTRPLISDFYEGAGDLLGRRHLPGGDTGGPRLTDGRPDGGAGGGRRRARAGPRPGDRRDHHEPAGRHQDRAWRWADIAAGLRPVAAPRQKALGGLLEPPARGLLLHDSSRVDGHARVGGLVRGQRQLQGGPGHG